MSIESMLTWLGVALALLELAAIAAAAHAVMTTRSSQGAIAWSLFLLTFPVISLPVYLVLGRRKFQGYVDARREGDLEIHKITRELRKKYQSQAQAHLQETSPQCQAFAHLARMPFSKSNEVQLLIDGAATFAAIFAAIESAGKYVLVQFYIIHNDDLGRQLKSRLIRKANDGVKVYFLYDEIGSYALPGHYIDELANAGVEVQAFKSTQGKTNRFQINFRNHRKIVVIDGKIAFIGGHNVGDEYVGKHPTLTPWRDTHVQISGPAAIASQIVFLEDWYWAAGAVPELNWEPSFFENANQQVLILPTGPADQLDTCALAFVHAINSATERIWIVSPYFVPDDAVTMALQLAAARGVDVRVLLPEKADHKIVYLAGFAFYQETINAGVKLYRYKKGFLHQKVFLLDNALAAVGTANLDNRSFRLNFEVTMLCNDAGFVAQTEDMLKEDFSSSRLVAIEELTQRSLLFRAAVSVTRLFSPML
ncbi:cardiolipin synthase [Kaarinaea lacus]